eukprot:GFYU01007429.1.p1 GENE.GFYU01007429.1~~GFYU01007429.1.p1  ORF type:complete len:111 (-),score=26.01 GFYU01007429.1:33-341(-)
MICLGFKFGTTCYLSDCHTVPEDVAEQIKGCELLVLDCLRLENPHKSHLVLDQCIEVAVASGAKRTLLVGMDHSIDGYLVNKRVEQYNIAVAYDGLVESIVL